MFRAIRNRVLAAAAFTLALTFVFAAATRSQQQPQQAPAKCATATVRLSSATPKPGDELLATVAVQSCAAEKERVVIQYSYTDPCGNKVEMGTAPVRLAAGEKQDATLNFLAPSVAECAGDFTVSAAVVADGNELNRASTTFKVSAH
jgi:uncharacterized protein (DUF58 family)